MKKTPLYLAIYLMEIGYGLFIVTASIMAARAIRSPALVGLTGTLHVSTRILGNVVFGRLSDRVGRKPLILLACALFLLAFAALGLARIETVLLAYVLTGLASSIFWPLIEAWIAFGEHGQGLLRFFGVFGAIFTAGIGTGSLLASLYTRMPQAATLATGGLLLFAVGLLIARTRDAGRGGDTEAATCGEGLSTGDRLLRRRYLFIGWIANFASWTTIGISRFLFAKLCQGLGIPESLIGTINAAMYGAWALSFLVLLRFRHWTYRLGPLVAFQFLGAAAIFLIWLRPSTPILFLGFMLFGVSAGMVYLSSIYYGQNGAVDKGNKGGLHEMILGLGMLIGPFIGGALAERFELRTPFLFAAAVILLAIGAEYALAIRPVVTVGQTKGASG